MKRLLIAGFGDIARRLRAQLPNGTEVRALSRRTGYDLDRPETLADVAGWPDAVLHCAPPPGAGDIDPRIANLAAILERGILPARFVYVSTSGVYGDCRGDLVDESRVPNPQSPRARRRVDAERRLQDWCARHGIVLLVPRVLEARGLDVTPVMMKRLRHVGDLESVAVLEIILRDEVGHVEIGSRWFKYFCDQRGLNREQTFRELISRYFAGQLRGPFDYDARIKAGFSEAELRALEGLESGA